jgi:hypothetical protein
MLGAAGGVGAEGLPLSQAGISPEMRIASAATAARVVQGGMACRWGGEPVEATRLVFFRQADQLEQAFQIIVAVILDLQASLLLPVMHGNLGAEMLA